MRQVPSRSRKGDGRSTTSSRNIFVALALASQLPTANAIVFPSTHPNYKTDYLSLNKRYNPARRGPPEDWNGRIPLKITNTCSEPIWPGITTQHGVGPGTGGFELGAGESRDLWVGPTWQGRAWGRTNCTVNGESAGCTTGDCFGKLNCEFSGAVPATLAEFNLAGGVSGRQTFYDISLVDGYNIPVGINYIPAENTSYIPPNLTNCACIATAGLLSNTAASGTVYTNSTYPVPWEPTETNNSARDWCPWPLLSMPPEKPGDGVYPYPDDNIMRPDFSPCKSQCAATNSDKDCCIGSWHDPNKCKPGLYSKHAKSICPDAYSFAFDDQTSTFIIPSGGGWEVVFCPAGRSTNILRTMGPQLFELASAGYLSQKNLDLVKNLSYIESQSEKNAAPGVASKSAWAVCAAAVTALLMAI
ncbi:Pathogenesis-related protein 5 [Colletotrichum siamense]|uniref:Pathogenesis-related protein 5 n=1 Tax=Colletotrichum siamense TaxID=690259 RepID=A0A9P5F0M0_COLSI|nr:Pathogenesis-related protein 5 [Colletotrichum siamense]KAF4863393.1 Pathogenesis-related protein 5 [Colletotrichum siamense]KAI8180852.1 Pathogenesis-related protein 5 [Colletotrichum sp. SAR 10_75]